MGSDIFMNILLLCIRVSISKAIPVIFLCMASHPISYHIPLPPWILSRRAWTSKDTVLQFWPWVGLRAPLRYPSYLLAYTQPGRSRDRSAWIYIWPYLPLYDDPSYEAWICPKSWLDYRWYQIFAIAGVILVTVSVAYGIGTHKDDLSASDKTAAIKWGWINQALSILATSLGKLSIVAFLQQIHGPEHRGRVIGLWALATSNLVVNVVTIAIIMTQCSPPGKLWNDKLQGSCSGRQRNEAIAYFQGSEWEYTILSRRITDQDSCTRLVRILRFGSCVIPDSLPLVRETSNAS